MCESFISSKINNGHQYRLTEEEKEERDEEDEEEEEDEGRSGAACPVAN